MTVGRALVAAGALAAGCASLGRGGFERPEVTLAGVTPAGVDLQGATLELALRITNPNRFEIEGYRMDLAFDVEGAPFGHLAVQTRFRLPARGDTTLRVPFRVLWSGVGRAVRGALLAGEVEYRLRGEVQVETPYGRGPVPFDRVGTFNVAGRLPGPGGPPEERDAFGN